MGVEYTQDGQKKRVGGENFMVLKMQCIGFNKQKTDSNFHKFVFFSV